MNRIFRLSAVIWFLLFALLFSALGYGLSGPLTRWSLEKTLQGTSGLPVTVDTVSVSLMPLSINITGIEWPDSENSHKNAVTIQDIKAKLRFGPLLRGNVIIDEATIGPVMTDQPRTIAWEPLSEVLETKENSMLDPVTVAAKDKTKEMAQQARMSAVEILKVEQENLLTSKKARQLKTQTNEFMVELNQLQSASPNKSDIEALQGRYRVLLNSKLDSPKSIVKFEADWAKLKKEINTVKSSSLAPIKKLDQGRKELNVTFTELKQAPKDDWKNLTSKYQPGNVNAVELSQQLFGDEYSEYLEQGLYWYEKAKPWLPEKSSGDEDESLQKSMSDDAYEAKVWVFPTDNPEPGFWLKSASLTLITEKGTVFTKLQNWTSDLKQTKKPATATFSRYSDAEKLEGKLVVNPGNQTLVMNSINQVVSNIKLMPAVKIDNAILDSELRVAMVNQQLDLKLINEFSNSHWNNSKSKSLPEILTVGLSSIDKFDLTVNATGTIRSPNLQISSNLDRKLGQIWKADLDKEWLKTQKDIEKGLLSELSTATSSYEADLEKINGAKKEITDRSKELQDLVNGGMEQKITKAKKELQRKINAKKKELESELKNKLKLPGL